MKHLPIVYLGLGSNLGDREKNIRAALDLLSMDAVKIHKVSSIIETDPVGGPEQGLFLNAAAKVETSLLPGDLLNRIHQVESDLGRIRGVRNGPRTVDIDILLYDDVQINEPDLIIPHPRIKERGFVMRPLMQINPNFVI